MFRAKEKESGVKEESFLKKVEELKTLKAEHEKLQSEHLKMSEVLENLRKDNKQLLSDVSLYKSSVVDLSQKLEIAKAEKQVAESVKESILANDIKVEKRKSVEEPALQKKESELKVNEDSVVKQENVIKKKDVIVEPDIQKKVEENDKKLSVKEDPDVKLDGDSKLKENIKIEKEVVADLDNKVLKPPIDLGFVKKEKVVVDTDADDNDDAKVPQRNIADLVEESLKKNVDDIVEKDFNKRDIDDKMNEYKESKIQDVVGIEEEADSFHDINDEVIME